MVFLFDHMLSLILAVPVLGALVVLCMPSRCRIEIRIVSLSFSLITLLLTALMYASLEPIAEFQFGEAAVWIPSLGIAYRVGVDGVSALMILLTAILTPIAIGSAWNEIDRKVKAFHILVLVLQTALAGAFAAVDVFLFYVFWEMVLIPAYFIIGVWGSGNKIRSAITFVIFTTAGSLIMLVAMMYCADSAGSFDLVAWYAHEFGARAQLVLFLAFALAFAVKLPVIPFHTWLPNAHTDAPTAGSILLAGILLKLGAYGFYRFAMPLFPLATAAYAPYLLAAAAAAIVYAGLIALAQDDMKRLIAYASIAHMGFVLLGLFSLKPDAAMGAVLEMFNHGITTGALFMMTGFLYERTHTRMIGELGGAARPAPLLATMYIVFAFASAGLPGLSTFVGKFLVLLGSFQTRTWFALPALAGVIIFAVYMLGLVQRVFFGPSSAKTDLIVDDMGVREHLMAAPLIALIVAMGVYPQPWLRNMEASVGTFLTLSTRGVVMQKQPAPLSASERDVPPLAVPETPQPRLIIDETLPTHDDDLGMDADVDEYAPDEHTPTPDEGYDTPDAPAAPAADISPTPDIHRIDAGRYEVQVRTRAMPSTAPPNTHDGRPAPDKVTLPPLPPELEDR